MYTSKKESLKIKLKKWYLRPMRLFAYLFGFVLVLEGFLCRLLLILHKNQAINARSYTILYRRLVDKCIKIQISTKNNIKLTLVYNCKKLKAFLIRVAGVSTKRLTECLFFSYLTWGLHCFSTLSIDFWRILLTWVL